MQPKIFITEDGSHSLLNTQLNETYHSIHGAIQESRHVFIKNGFDHYLQQHPGCSKISIFEVGFGTGLNALLSLEHAKRVAISLDYVTLEAYPIAAETWHELNYASTLGMQPEFERLHNHTWNETHAIQPEFTFTKLLDTLQNVDLETKSFNVVYYDAFAPSKQPEMWELPLLEKVISVLKPHGVFVTYCAKGQLKRDLAFLGLKVATLPGPPGKKEMVCATKPELVIK